MTHDSSTAETCDQDALIEAIARQRDRTAFERLFNSYAPRIKAWMMRAGTHPLAAEELAQEAMLLVWQKARLFDPGKASASTWIFTIARNLRVDALRRERHPDDLADDPVREPDPPDRLFVHAEQEERIRAALDRLPPVQAEVIRKVFYEDKAQAQIVQELGIPLGTVKSRLRLAIGRLRKAVEDLA